MAKRRRQTQGRRNPSARQGTQTERDHESRAVREARLQRRVLTGTGITIGLVVLVLVAAVVIELVVTPNSVAASVGGDSITISEFQERVRLERAILNTRITNYVALLNASGLDPNQYAGQEPLRGWLSQINDPDLLGSNILDVLIENTLIRHEAEARGLQVSQDDIDRQIDEFLGLDPPTPAADPTPELQATLIPSPTRTPFVSPTPRQVPSATATPLVEEAAPAATEVAATTPTFTPVPPTATQTTEELERQQGELRESILNDLAGSARVDQGRLRAHFEALALREALAADLLDIGDSIVQVNARHILVAERSEADDLLVALAEGDSFAALAMANSVDAGSGRAGGELGWTPLHNFVRPFAEAVLAAEPGATIGPVETEFGWHVIQLRAKENRDASDLETDNARNFAFRNWLDDRRVEMDDSIEIFDVWADNVPDDPVLLLTG
ncbi:MAG: peptidylprolyl isomerase [Anaerolineaceae bacterium]|nr:peptidylprolyl isomerase [Anaerolineaceae bacterium]MDE0329676.1 peptidylprolyl isomerase [Anaerolineaceae bacterium]